jgi:hypothetical protein
MQTVIKLTRMFFVLFLASVGVTSQARAPTSDNEVVIGAGYDLKVFHDFQRVNVEACESIAPQFASRNREAFERWKRKYAAEVDLMHQGYGIALDLRSHGDSALRKRIADFDIGEYAKWRARWESQGLEAVSDGTAIENCSHVASFLAQLNPRSDPKVSAALTVVSEYLEGHARRPVSQ